MAADLAGLLSRLETVTNRLEKISLASGMASSGDDGSSDVSVPFIEAYDQLGQAELADFLASADKLGGEIVSQANLLKVAFDEERRLLVIASKSKKPVASEFQQLLKPLAESLEAIGNFRDLKENRRTKFPNHLAAVAEGAPALGWVTVEPKPAPFVKEMADAAEFYGNRVIKEYKDVDANHVAWARAYKAFLMALHDYVKKYHTTGLTWNPKGATVAASAEKKASAPPPPPLPAPAPAKAMPRPAMPDTSALFSQLNKGSAVTAGLKKVDKSQMTHKNPELRGSSVVKASAVQPKSAPPAQVGIKKSQGTPKFELEGKRWAVEWQEGRQDLVIDSADMSQTVYIYKCNNSVVKVNKKVNSIFVDSCKKLAVVFDTLVASFEAVNSQSIQVQALSTVPTINLDKTDGAQVFLSKGSLGVEIFTAKCSELNVVVPGDSLDDDVVEHPLPEQFKTVYDAKSKKFVTSTSEPSG